jgi:hypothetical protein
MQFTLTYLYEAFSKVYDYASDRICFMTGSTVGAIDLMVQHQQQEATNWTEFLIKTCVAGLAPLVLKKVFEAIVKPKNKVENENNI